MLHRLKIAPNVEPVTLAEMRNHLGITQPGETSRDAIITTRIASARIMAEFHTRQCLVTQTWIGYDCRFVDVIALKAPLQSVTSVKYLDSAGVQQTLAASAYDVDTVAGIVIPAYGTNWPTCREQPNAVQIEYVSGYGNAASAVPEPIKDAIRFIVGQWEMFQTTIEGGIRPLTIPNAAKQLLDPYCDYREIF